jgi:molybdate transport system substrate-binding protein
LHLLRRWLCLLLLLPVLAQGATQDSAQAVPRGAGITVFGAASLTDVLQAVARDYQQATGVPVRLSFAASSALARQIEAGARADLFLSADLEWMDYLEARELLRSGSRRNLLGNDLVLVAPAGAVPELRIGPGFPLAAALGRGRLAVGDPDLVPAGRYARAALTGLGVWPSVENRLVRTENVRVALAYVARGEVPLAIVYGSDALADRQVAVVDVFPAASHPPITYPVALTRAAGPDARAFLDYLSSPAARARFEAAGFRPLTEP